MTKHVDEVARDIAVIEDCNDGRMCLADYCPCRNKARAAMRAVVKQMRERTSANSMFDEYVLRGLNAYVKEAGIDD